MHRIFRCLGISALLALRAAAVEEGDTLATVIEEKGDPPSRIQMGDTLVLNYPDETIKLREGKVIAVKLVGTGVESAVRTRATVTPGQWTTSYASAVAQASEEKRNVLLFFTGSDWCPWCKKMDAEVFSQAEFLAYARENLVLVKIDYPRTLPQPAQVKQQNKQLEKQYQIGGYPTVIILNSRGKTIGELGYKEGGAKAFVNRLKRL